MSSTDLCHKIKAKYYKTFFAQEYISCCGIGSFLAAIEATAL